MLDHSRAEHITQCCLTTLMREILRDWARIMGIEFVHIDKNSTPEKLDFELNVSSMVWKNA